MPYFLKILLNRDWIKYGALKMNIIKNQNNLDNIIQNDFQFKF